MPTKNALDVIEERVWALVQVGVLPENKRAQRVRWLPVAPGGAVHLTNTGSGHPVGRRSR